MKIETLLEMAAQAEIMTTAKAVSQELTKIGKSSDKEGQRIIANKELFADAVAALKSGTLSPLERKMAIRVIDQMKKAVADRTSKIHMV